MTNTTATSLGERERAPIEHELKCWPGPFAAIKSGVKPFEFRKADRDFQVGDTLWLREWSPEWTPAGGGYTGDEHRAKVTYVLGALFGVPEGYCVMGLAAPPPDRGRADLPRLVKGIIEQAMGDGITELRFETHEQIADKATAEILSLIEKGR